jgi:hypothetical protein
LQNQSWSYRLSTLRLILPLSVPAGPYTIPHYETLRISNRTRESSSPRRHPRPGRLLPGRSRPLPRRQFAHRPTLGRRPPPPRRHTGAPGGGADQRLSLAEPAPAVVAVNPSLALPRRGTVPDCQKWLHPFARRQGRSRAPCRGRDESGIADPLDYCVPVPPDRRYPIPSPAAANPVTPRPPRLGRAPAATPRQTAAATGPSRRPSSPPRRGRSSRTWVGSMGGWIRWSRKPIW